MAVGTLAIAIALAIAFFPTRRGVEKKDPGAAAGQGTPDPAIKPAHPPDPAETREARAEDAYRRLITVSQRSEATPEEVLAAVERASADCKGSKYEADLEKIRNAALRDKEQAESLRILQPLLEDLKKSVAADAAFARFAEIQEKFRKARELANRSASTRVSEINRLQEDYGGRYEKAAGEHLAEIEETARVLADERRYDAALAKIETFPREFRQSGAWRSLATLKEDIDRRKKLFPSKP